MSDGTHRANGATTAGTSGSDWGVDDELDLTGPGDDGLPVTDRDVEEAAPAALCEAFGPLELDGVEVVAGHASHVDD